MKWATRKKSAPVVVKMFDRHVHCGELAKLDLTRPAPVDTERLRHRTWSLDDERELAGALAHGGTATPLDPARAWRSLGLARQLLRRGPIPNWLRALMHRRRELLQGDRDERRPAHPAAGRAGQRRRERRERCR